MGKVEVEKGRLLEDYGYKRKLCSGLIVTLILIMFEEYTGRTEKGLIQPEKTYKAARKGEKFYLVYISNNTKPFAVYSAQEYYFSNIAFTDPAATKLREITQDMMLRDANGKRSYVAHLFFIMLGLGVTLLPIIQIGVVNADAVIGVVVMFLLFGVPFGGFCGVYPLMQVIFIDCAIKNGKLHVIKDRVTDKQYREKNERRRCLLMFKDYSAKTGKGIFFNDSMYEKVKNGDQFYLVYAGRRSKPVITYFAKEYYYAGQYETVE